jgi:hypothetical protein
MSVWDVRCDVANFATMYLVNEFGQPLDFCPEWPDFEGQKIGENCFQCKTKLKKNKPVANFTYLARRVCPYKNYTNDLGLLYTSYPNKPSHAYPLCALCGKILLISYFTSL